MGRTQELRNPRRLNGEVEKEIFDEFEKIWRRDGFSGKSELLRKIVTEYVSTHAEGNSTFKLDKWNEDPQFKAVPTILSRSETWYKYLQECSPQERLQIQIQANHINKQCININSLK